jgi:hypothetical protein
MERVLEEVFPNELILIIVEYYKPLPFLEEMKDVFSKREVMYAPILPPGGYVGHPFYPTELLRITRPFLRTSIEINYSSYQDEGDRQTRVIGGVNRKGKYERILQYLCNTAQDQEYSDYDTWTSQ